jgi:CubicO group peptidase (beta-lactamase class C family)
MRRASLNSTKCGSQNRPVQDNAPGGACTTRHEPVMVVDDAGFETGGNGVMNEGALARLVAAVRADIDAGQYDGAVLALAHAGRLGLLNAVGSTDRSRGRPARTDDVFLLMSMTKTLTAGLVLQLIDEGRLTLDTPVSSVVPEFGVKGKQNVTVYHLLTHTGGVWSQFSPAPGLSGTDMGNLAAMVDAVSNSTLLHAPGTQVTYSPWASFAILGELARRIDGRSLSFADLMTERIFTPLGMSDTTIGLPMTDPRRVPVVVRDEAEGVAPRASLEALNEVLDETSERPSGGAFSTAHDVVRFAEMLRCHGRLGSTRLLSPAIVRYALRVHTGDMPNVFWDYAKQANGIPDHPANFGLGVYVRGKGHHFTPLGLTASPRAFGAIGGGSTGFVVDPDRDLTFVFLSAGFVEGLGHFARMQRLSDLAIACVDR